LSAIETIGTSASASVRTLGVDAARFIENGGADLAEDFRRAVFGGVVGTLGITASAWVAFAWLRAGECWAAVFVFLGSFVVASIVPSLILEQKHLYRPRAT